MTISIWRYSHLALAIASSVFLIIASVTGIILAFEPISDAVQPYEVANLNTVTLAQTLEALDENYEEVLALEIDANDFVIASVITQEGASEKIYINPITAEKLGEPKEKATLFQWTTNLHRSLFLKSTGRFFVGLISLLLCLITVTGFFLIAKRQGGIKKIFSKVQKEYFEQRYHVILGRWLLLPILIVAATGVYLSAEKFSLLPSDDLKHSAISFDENSIPENHLKQLLIFQNTTLNAVRKLTFPFSEDSEDYFELALNDRELYIHQYTGVILSEAAYPFVTLASRFSLTMHTGQGSILWSLILLITSLSLLFFMYSGFAMALKRRKKIKAIAPLQNKDECEYILLVGSETGSTNDFATIFQNALSQAGKNVFKSDLNSYTTYQKAKHIIIFTATYGEGDAPTNARNFKNIFESIQVDTSISFSVLGFGSLAYPDYCKFATEIDSLCNSTYNFKAILPLYKVNNQSFEAFNDWTTRWANATEILLTIKQPKKTTKRLKTSAFKIINKTDSNSDDTFLIRLRPKKKVKFQSGDLLACRPKKEEVARLYSIAKIENDILLSIKIHEFGICSNYFSELSENDLVNASIKRNQNFHFPKNTKEIVCIANGTGIAPFLGIIAENTKQIPIHLYWGGRTKVSFETYKEVIDTALSSGKLSTISIAYSKAYQEKIYVQDLILEMKDNIAQKLDSGAVFMICGSMAMQNEVLHVLEEIAIAKLNMPLSEFENRAQLKMDCY